jgi:hypothetical protein
MKLTAIFQPAEEGGYSCFVDEVPAAISQGVPRHNEIKEATAGR